MTPRRLLVFLRHLPMGSAYFASRCAAGELRRDEGGDGGQETSAPDGFGWDRQVEMLAAVLDAVRANTHALLQVNSTSAVPAADPTVRPWQGPLVRRVRARDLPGAVPLRLVQEGDAS